MDYRIKTCRICQSTSLHEVLDLGSQVITSRFPVKGDHSTPSTPVCLVMCEQCRLVQLRDTTESSELYEHLYGYRSGISQTMRDHLMNFNHSLQQWVSFNDGDYVLDIGSNDSTFLSYYPSNVTRVGCDPTGKQFSQYYAADMKLIPTYFTEKVIRETFGDGVRFKAVTSISMFYDLPDPVQFAKDIHSILEEEGIWALEQSYVGTMLKRNSIDTICHEHLEYYGLKQIKEIMDRAGFKIIDVSFNDCNGGSFRILVAKQTATLHSECTETIQTLLQSEEDSGMHTIERYEKFYEDCLSEVNRLVAFIRYAQKDNKKVYIYGASTKGNCLLQFGKIDSTLIPYAVERNPLKYGHTTSTGIEIISEDQMRQDHPEYLLVLPWHFRDEIIKRESEYLERGGALLFPFPHFELYTAKPRCLITGMDGQIGHYVKEQFQKSHQLYGIVHSMKDRDSAILRIQHNMDSYSELDQILQCIRPHSIIHLASLSNTEVCEAHPIPTILTNGVSVSYLCEIIRKRKLGCSLFHASSSELFKGHGVYEVVDDSTDFHPITIYGISKQFGHQVVQYYRKKYGLPFSNGILFTTESPLRNHRFVLQKMIRHASSWAQTRQPLELGSVDSYRNLIHASDVASAVAVILKQPVGGEYVISNLEGETIEGVMQKVYQHYGMDLQKQGDSYVDSKTGETVVVIGESLRGSPTHIDGRPDALLKLGWKPMYSLEGLLEDLFV